MQARTWIAIGLGAAVLATGASPAAAQGTGQCPWMDASAPPRERAAELLAAMSLDDKIALSFGSLSSYGFAAQTPANDRLCIPAFVYSDGPAGIAGGFGGTQTGVTAFPTGIAQGASWNPALERRFGTTIAREALAKGANVLLGPAMNINRVPMNGRNFEYFGEDPYLSSRIAVAETKGIQQEPVVATIKHYAANNQETDRMSVSVQIDERTLREIYLPAFEAAVKEGRAGSVMCAYNRLRGKYACENPHLLTGILKHDWGFDGWVMSDWLATHSTEAAVLAGLDQEQNGSGQNWFGDKLKAAVEAGKVPRARIDDLVLRILRPAFRIGLFDHRPAAQPGAYGANVSSPAHRAVAAAMAEQGAVLLKNDAQRLPLDTVAPGTRIAVIGRFAAPAGAQAAAVGSGSAHVNGQITDPLSAIQSRAAAQQAVVTYTAGDARADAVAAASAADVAIVFARDNQGEGVDRPSLALNDGACVLIACEQSPNDQNATIAAVAAANPNTVVVLLTGGPISMPWLDSVKSVLEVWWAGTEYGTAVAALLFGDANPSGKLSQTFPRAAGDMPFRSPEQYPGKDGKVHYSEGLQVGYRWYDAQGIEPLFPFGFGLSYTTFAVDGPRLARGRGASLVDVRLGVRNTGRRTGAEVAQVYVGFPKADGEPPKQLKGFRKVSLDPGTRRSLRIGLGERAFSHWDARAHGWTVTPGCYAVMAGSSSRAIAGRATVRLAALPLRDPRGREALRSATLRVGGAARRTLRGAGLRRALRSRRVLVALPGGRARVTLSARTTTGRAIRSARAYRVCSS